MSSKPLWMPQSYSANDLVKWNGKIYKAKNDITVDWIDIPWSSMSGDIPDKGNIVDGDDATKAEPTAVDQYIEITPNHGFYTYYASALEVYFHDEITVSVYVSGEWETVLNVDHHFVDDHVVEFSVPTVLSRVKIIAPDASNLPTIYYIKVKWARSPASDTTNWENQGSADYAWDYEQGYEEDEVVSYRGHVYKCISRIDMGQNICTGGTPISSPGRDSGGLDTPDNPSKCFDGDREDEYPFQTDAAGSSVEDCYVGYVFDDDVFVDSVVLVQGDLYYGSFRDQEYVTGVYIQKWKESTGSWQTVLSGTATYGVKTYSLPYYMETKKIRVIATTGAPTGEHWSVHEVEMNGTMGPNIDTDHWGRVSTTLLCNF